MKIEGSKNIYDNQHPSWLLLSEFEINYTSQSFFFNCIVSPALITSFIESSYILNFMRNSANVISCQSQGRYLIFHNENGRGGDGRFGFWAETLII